MTTDHDGGIFFVVDKSSKICRHEKNSSIIKLQKKNERKKNSNKSQCRKFFSSKIKSIR